MALDSNAQMGANGQPLPHFTPWPTKDSAGINVFSQRIYQGRAYKKQKSQLELEFQQFLDSLPWPKTLLSASPCDILRFPVWKDRQR